MADNKLICLTPRNEIIILARYYCLLAETIVFGPIGKEKQNFTSFLLIVIKLSIKKQNYS